MLLSSFNVRIMIILSLMKPNLHFLRFKRGLMFAEELVYQQRAADAPQKLPERGVCISLGGKVYKLTLEVNRSDWMSKRTCLATRSAATVSTLKTDTCWVNYYCLSIFKRARYFISRPTFSNLYSVEKIWDGFTYQWRDVDHSSKREKDDEILSGGKNVTVAVGIRLVSN